MARRQRLLACFWFATGAIQALLGSSFAGAATLKDVCGPTGHSKVAGSQMAEQLCQSAYTSGNGWVVNNNNSRVSASVAIVCAYSCIAGGATSCSGGGGSPCSQAADNGYRSFNQSDISSQYYTDAQNNGLSAQNLESGAPVTTLSKAVPHNVPALPDACASAQSSGSVQDRIGCAVATDPSLPAFVSSPQFLADFKKVTGQDLQDVINQDGSTILDQYAGSALKNAYEQTGGKLGFTDFLKNGATLVGAILGKMTSTDQQGRFLANVIPSQLHGLIPGVTPAGRSAPNGAASATAIASNSAPATPSDPSLIPKSPSELRDPIRSLASVATTVDGDENDRSFSIFLRVTGRYRKAMAQGDVASLDWVIPNNRFSVSR